MRIEWAGLAVAAMTALLLLVPGCRLLGADGTENPAAEVGAVGPEGQENAAAEPEQTVTVVEMAVEHAPKQIPLNYGHVGLRQDDGTIKEVPVRLDRTVYRAKLRLTEGDIAKEWRGWLAVYDLRSTDPGLGFSWCVCRMNTTLANFGLLRTQSGDNYLSWVEGPYAMLARITGPRTFDTALHAAVFLRAQGKEPGIMRVLVPRFFPDEEFWGNNALHAEITVLGVVEEPNGGLAVTVRGVDPAKQFTVILQDGEWRAGTGETAQPSVP